MKAGEVAADGLFQQALGGTFRMDVAGARKCAANFLRFADALDPQIERAREAGSPSGFGGFDSAHQLERGFGDKATQLTTAVTGLRDSALRMAAAYLLAAGVITETDDHHSRALLSAQAGLDSPS
ncbi:hypothetical protein JK358_31960 [Nocardia sp. 2]|uniref:ESX-1 secretion-associated protein n=1 Tax=Nocardia acididurans TaxID=2802282 RepID=A0ABS1MH86_9NOCA|nr:hypothetical protein [Nocardia acididurans]MBL1079029.1 hypothetical protein [Nocardia acididurans]